jgi:hypothetical protein
MMEYQMITTEAAEEAEAYAAELEAIIRQLTEAGKAQAKQADLCAGLPNSVNDTAP